MTDEQFMKKAISQADVALKKDEVPIGAVIVCEGKVIARAHNMRNKSKNAINHAEMLAITKACKVVGDWRLENCEIYVTLEPCPMCAGAICNARIKRCIFGAFDKTSKTNLALKIFEDKRLNHNPVLSGGVLEKECSTLLEKFFKDKRAKNNQ